MKPGPPRSRHRINQSINQSIDRSIDQPLFVQLTTETAMQNIADTRGQDNETESSLLITALKVKK